MKLCILDPAVHVPCLKQLFPEADYYAHEPDEQFKFVATQHYTHEETNTTYGFEYRIDWDSIRSDKYDYIFIVVPLMDYYQPFVIELSEQMINMRNKIKNILDQNLFKKVVIFDVYDYDYDPSVINTEWKADFYFKRNYNKTKTYAQNVYPFPYMMFVKPCVLGMVLNAPQQINTSPYVRIPRALWSGLIYNHIDSGRNIYRMREDMYNQIYNHPYLDTKQIPESEYIKNIQQYKIVIDLLGVGDPNKRTFEILSNDSLMLSMCGDLDWGFENQDHFHPDTFFKTAEEFNQKLTRLVEDETHYQTCLSQQRQIIQKYFNGKWLRSYIEKNIQYPVQDTVSLFLTSCNRPFLLKYTLESFVKYNTYPIEYGVIVEDSGLQGINDFAHDIVPFPLLIIYTQTRKGQMKSVENGLQYLNTKYVFHCEEDWEFYDYGFIEDSLKILKRDPLITSVRLRSHDEMRIEYKLPIYPKYDYYIVGPETGNFSWNPGLRTVEVQKMFTPYSLDQLCTICEGGLDQAFRNLGMTTAMTNKLNGYVRHIGWGYHVE